MADIQQTHIFNLPTHILTDIFQRLPQKDLIRLTTVCKYFNNIISNSPEVLMELPVDLDRGTLRNWKCNRKYSNVTVTTRNFKNRLPILESLADSIVIFAIIYYGQHMNRQNFNINDLIEVLQKMSNLREVFIDLPNDFNEGRSEDTPRLSLKLDSIDGTFNPDLFSLFYNCSVKFCIAIFNNSNTDFFEFLNGQNELKHLIFGSSDLEPFSVESLLNVKFRLKSLAMIFSRADNVDNLAKFLLQFRQSLKCLHLLNYDERIWKILPHFENLKTLAINKPHPFESYAGLVIPNIRNLYIDKHIHPHLPIMFPNLTHITINNPTDIDALCQFAKLESITVCDNIQTEICRSSAKKLTIIHHGADQRPFDYDNHNFKEILVTKRNEKTPRWLKDFIKGGYAANLKIFSVITKEYVDGAIRDMLSKY